MAELILVRHGQASFGAANYDQLSDLGLQQSKWLGEYFEAINAEFDLVLSGSLIRHQQTLEGIQTGMGKRHQHQVFEGLNEFSFEAMIKSYLAMYPEEQPQQNAPRKTYYRLLKRTMKKWMAGELEGDIPETWGEFEHRVLDVFNWLRQNQTGKKVLAISSGGAISMAIATVLKAPKETVTELNLQQKNTGYAHFYFNKENFRLTGMNYSPHLDSPERMQHLTFS